MRHVHRWTPYGNPTRFYQCHCGKTQKRAPVNQRDVAARKRAGREARRAREAQQAAVAIADLSDANELLGQIARALAKRGIALQSWDIGSDDYVVTIADRKLSPAQMRQALEDDIGTIEHDLRPRDITNR